jgi:S1-C subfamily serine protease
VARRLGITVAQDPDGRLRVVGVAASTPAEKTGIRAGDRIVKLAVQGNVVTIRIERDGWERTFTFELEGDAPAAPRGQAFLGVYVTPRVGSGGGLRIERIVKGSAAEQAGLRRGDVLLEADGRDLRERGDLVAVVSRKSAGERLRVRLERDEWARRMEIVLGPRDAPSKPDEPGTAWLGVAIVERDGAVVVLEVAPGSPAQAALIRAGDRIVAFFEGETRRPIEGPEEFTRLMESRRAGTTLVLELEREGWAKRVTVRLSERPPEDE